MSEIQFVKADAKIIERELIQAFEKATGETLYPGDERRIFLMQELPVLVGLKNDINATAKQNLLRYAMGEVLDALGERTDTFRALAQKASTTLRLTLSAAQTFDVTIPKGTRVTPDGKLYFATTKDITILAGQSFGDVTAESTLGGSGYNGFSPGQIKNIVDPVPFVASAANIDTSAGGSDVETDESYRERIRQAPTKFSTAGPKDGYIYWAMTADTNIQDVAVTSPSPGQVKITVLMKGGQQPSQATLDAVYAACSDRKRRPLTDQVIVAAPTTVSYSISLTYYISKDRTEEETAIRSALEDTDGVIDQYIKWQSSKLGRGINPDDLRQLMLNAGAFRIDMVSPAFTNIAEDKVASITAITINYGGLI